MRLAVISGLAGVLLLPLLAVSEAHAQAAAPGASATVPGSPAPAASAARPDPQTTLQQAVAEMQRLMKEGRKAEAIAVAGRAMDRLQAEAGPEHPLTAVAIFNLGAVQRMSGAADEAAITLRRALALEGKLGGPSRPNYRRALTELAEAEKARGHVAEAIDLYEAALERLRQGGTGTLAEAELLEEQATLIRYSGGFQRAEAKFKAALTIKQSQLVPSDPSLVALYNQLGGVLRLNGRHGEAESYYKRAIEIVAATKGENDANLAVLIDNLGVLYNELARYEDAEVQHKRALAIFEATLGRDHPSTAQCAANLGAIAYQQRRYAEAEKLIERALEVYSKTLPPNDWRLGITLDNLAGVYRNQGRYDRAAESYQRAIDVLRKAYSDKHPDVGTALNNLALMNAELGRIDEAERLTRESLAIAMQTHGEKHVQIAAVLNTLGYVHNRQGRPSDARKDYERSIAMIEAVLGADHGMLVQPLSDLGSIVLAQGDVRAAHDLFQRAADIELKQRARGASSRQSDGQPQMLDPFLGLIDASWQRQAMAPAAGGNTAQAVAAAADETLVQAQHVLQSSAGRTMAQLGARLGAKTPAIAQLARERQDLSDEWSSADRKLTALLSKTGKERADGDDKPLRARLTDIDAKLAQIDGKLAKEHPTFLDLAQPNPIGAKDVRALLGANEALLTYLPTDKAVYAWLVTRNEIRWQRIELSRSVLQEKIRTLRCGLDPSEWYEPAREKRCLALTGKAPAGDLLPFSLPIAAELHGALIAPFAKALEGKHLLVVAGGALSSLPLQVLVGEAPKDGSLVKAKWLGSSHAMTTLPSIASLKTLRRDARASAAQRPYFGIGNPLLIGPNRDYSASWGAQSCLASQLKKTAPMVVAKVDARGSGNLVRGGTVDVEQVRLLSPLPETREELCTVAASAGASEADLALGSRASEKYLRELNASGALRNYRMLHFATHGLVAGEVPGLDEAALVMTPPDTYAADNDGLLTASEVASLRLDADWVVLSACNTAAGDRLGAETLSGLARAFFHAGARSLLVSHWPVQSMAAVKLTTRALAEMKKFPGVGRAEALRRSMAALIVDASNPANAHPQVWAPFVVVGEGGSPIAATPISSVAPAAGAAGAAAAAASRQPAGAAPRSEVLPWLKDKAAPQKSAAPGKSPTPDAKAATPAPAGAQPAPQPAVKSPIAAPAPSAAPTTTQALPQAQPQPAPAAPSPAATKSPAPSLSDSMFR